VAATVSPGAYTNIQRKESLLEGDMVDMQQEEDLIARGGNESKRTPLPLYFYTTIN
jgi:hypothetical protein